MMVDERDCDVEDLSMEDFVDGESTETASFVISLMKWAKIGMLGLFLIPFKSKSSNSNTSDTLLLYAFRSNLSQQG